MAEQTQSYAPGDFPDLPPPASEVGVRGWIYHLATAPEHRYQHHWRVGDLLIWDNRCVLHRGRPYDADRYRRRMHQTRVAGICSSLDED